jgi:SAM-dependent methyltransferase
VRRREGRKNLRNLAKVSNLRKVAEKVDPSITLGRPSYVWRAGQERRLDLIRRYAPLAGKRVLDAGCGVGMYVAAFRRFTEAAYGVDLDPEKVAQAARQSPHVQVASVEALPYADASFDVVLSHEVIEHVSDDRAAVAEAVRVLRPGGRLVLYAPNRLYFFETHGCFWRGRYHFGNAPLVNWLPTAWRDRLCPHARAYTARGLRRLLDGLPVEIVAHTQVYPGFDNVVARRPRLGRWLRRVLYALERTPLRAFGLSHLLVVERK